MQKKPRQRRKRPIAVTIVAWAIFITFLVRLYQVIEPLLLNNIFNDGMAKPLFGGGWLTAFGMVMLTSATYAVLSLSGIIILIGFLRMKRWSWIVLMVWTGISLSITLFDYFYHQPNYIIMACDTIVAFALNQADVQRIFKIRMDPGERID